MTDLEHLTLAGVAHRCAQESELFFRRENNDPRFCFELFRRAILDCDREAWDCIYAQYHSLTLKWVNRHPAFPVAEEEPQYFVNRAFEKMWSALTPDKFAGFADLKSVLRYLQMCVHSVVVDHVRTTERLKVSLEALTVEKKSFALTVEEEALARSQRQMLWDRLGSRLRDEKERQVVYGSFVLDLKPQELQAVFQGTFQDVGEIYRIKQNILDRLRRDPEFIEFHKPKS